MNINPCLLVPQNWVITFHRKCLASTMLIELLFVIGLVVTSFFCKNTRSQKQGSSLQIKQDNVVRIQVIQKSNMEDKSIMPFRQKQKHQSNTTSIRKENQLSTIKPQAIQKSSKPQKQPKKIISIKNLVLYQKDIRAIMGIEVGNQFICIAIAMMYFPFALTTLACFIQLLLFIIHYLLCICSDNFLAKFTKGALFILNIPMMAFSIYGLCTNIPQVVLNSCFDL